jgi:RNA polymerase sigma-32 factor
MSSLPTRSSAFDRYVAEMVKYPLLTREREKALAERYRNLGDLDAARELVVSNLRFVVKISGEYRGYGLRRLDLIQEGSLGLMQAVRKFDPSKGFRLISYAVWWIRAAINSFVMRSWSLVKLGTTQTQRKLFFKLRSARSRADGETGGDARASTDLLVERFNVAENDIAAMEGRLAARDLSLEAQVDMGARQVRVHSLSAYPPSQEERVNELERVKLVHASVSTTMKDLSERERYVVENRLMATEPETLQSVGERFRISRERVRQIEGKILGKIRTAFLSQTSPMPHPSPSN